MNGFGRGFASIPPVLKNLLIINVLMFLVTFVAQSVWGYDLNRILGLYYFKSEYFRPYQVVTHMFMHGGFTHIFLNMFMLWMFGRVLEQVWSGKRFLFYYFFTGLGAAALHLFVMHIEISSLQRELTAFTNTPAPELFNSFISKHIHQKSPQIYDFINTWSANPNNPEYGSQAISYIKSFIEAKMNVPTVGASGAIYGVLLAFGVIFPNMPLILIFFPFFPIKAKYMVMGMGALELFYGLSQPGSNVAHFAHLGGMLFGLILIRYWKKNTKTFY